MDILAELNAAQKEAVEAVDGPVLILAGPGSGKTRVITHRVAYLIRVCGVDPRHIMAVTFTNKAARSMEDRLRLLASNSVADLTMGTFHAICARILRIDGRAMSVDANFVIYDRDDQISLIKRGMPEIGLDPKQYTPQTVISAISAAKCHTITPDDYTQHSHSYFEEVVGRVYQHYQHLLAESNALDFDDLLMKTVLLFRKNPDILSRYQTRYRHLLVDEFQDTNLVQYELIKQLGDKHRNICVVGDPDQSIYAWRFADLNNILNFEKDYPGTKLVVLEENYRSTKVILETANSIISSNQQRKPKNLWTTNPQGEPATIVETYTEQEEAQFVVNEIDRIVELGDVSFGDCAVMYRTNAQSRVLEEAFVRYGTPHKLVAGTRFYERREVKDIIAYLKFIQNPSDSVSLSRIINVPQRGIGQQTQLRLSNWAKSLGVSPYQALTMMAENSVKESDEPAPFTAHVSKTLAHFQNLISEAIDSRREGNMLDLFDLVVQRSGYKEYISNGTDGEERWTNVMELRSVAQMYRDLPPEEGLAAFLDGVTLVSDVDQLDESASAVTLITLHQAKGLEFPIVFIVGMEEGILPHFKSIDDPEQLEEERRLCYVGITRAKEKIYLVRAFRRNLMGRSLASQPSRFLEDIPQHLITGNSRCQEDESQPVSSLYSWDKSPATIVVSSDLAAGDHVRHTQFGNGVVVSCQAVKDDSELVVAFNGGVKKLLLSLAHLEKLV